MSVGSGKERSTRRTVDHTLLSTVGDLQPIRLSLLSIGVVVTKIKWLVIAVTIVSVVTLITLVGVLYKITVMT